LDLNDRVQDPPKGRPNGKFLLSALRWVPLQTLSLAKKLARSPVSLILVLKTGKVIEKKCIKGDDVFHLFDVPLYVAQPSSMSSCAVQEEPLGSGSVRPHACTFDSTKAFRSRGLTGNKIAEAAASA